MIPANQGITEHAAGAIFAQMVIGLDYIHSAGYIHGDIKPDNILLHYDGDEYWCMLADFGWAR